jgi:hypothetical protein
VQTIETGAIVWAALLFSCMSSPNRAERPPMTDLQWFAFVYLPIGVCVFGALLAVVGVKLINLADRRKPRAAE